MRKRKASTRTPFVVKQEEGIGEIPSEVLYDYVVDPAASQRSEETSGAFTLMEIFCVLQQSLPPC